MLGPVPLPPPAGFPEPPHFAFVLGRRTREQLQLVVVYAAASPPPPSVVRVGA